jgi:hypothetical protein
MEKAVLELRKYTKMCKMNSVNKRGNTSSTWAFRNNTYEIAIEILKHVDTNITDVPSKFLGYISDIVHQDRETLRKTTEENNLVVKKKNDFGFVTTYY